MSLVIPIIKIIYNIIHYNIIYIQFNNTSFILYLREYAQRNIHIHSIYILDKIYFNIDRQFVFLY